VALTEDEEGPLPFRGVHVESDRLATKQHRRPRDCNHSISSGCHKTSRTWRRTQAVHPGSARHGGLATPRPASARGRRRSTAPPGSGGGDATPRHGHQGREVTYDRWQMARSIVGSGTATPCADTWPRRPWFASGHAVLPSEQGNHYDVAIVNTTAPGPWSSSEDT
jgi:hypothetical protein